VQERQEVALVVARAAGVQAAVADRGIERIRRPERARIRRLHVVVAVDQHRGRIGPARAQLAGAKRVAESALHLGAAAGGSDALAGPVGRALEIGGIASAGGDRGNAEPVAQLGEKRVRHGAEAILQAAGPVPDKAMDPQ
jgi:hypothetical protein